MSAGRVGDGGAAAAAAARRAAEEAARRAAAEAARRAAEAAARQAAAEAASRTAAQQKSTFEPAAPKNTLNLDGQGAPASSLFTENSKDGQVNCLDQAADWVNKSTPEQQRRSELVFLEDSRAGTEGQTGHVVVREGERVHDPSSGKSYEDMKAYLREQPHYREAGSMSGTAAAEVFSTEPGSFERAQALADAKVSPELQRMMVADPPITELAPNPATVEPRNITVPGQPGPVSVEFSDTLEKDVKKEDGYVTVSINAETNISASGTVEFGKAKVGASVGGGVSAGKDMSYEVKMKEEDFEKLKRGEIPPPHPLNPETLPDGASIKMEQRQFKGYSMEAGLSYHEVELGLSGEVTEGKGMSVEISRNGDKVQVTAGPTEFIENDGKASIGAGPVSVSAGRTDTLEEYKLRTAEFDLSNPEGQKAFESFREDGRMPEKEGPGVSNTLRFDKLNYESVGGKFGIEAGPFSAESEGTTNTGDYLITHHPDGTKSLTVDVTYGGDHPDLTFEQKYGKDGKPIAGTDKYALKFDTQDDDARELLVYAYTGDEAQAKAARGNDEPITLNLTANDVRELQRRALDRPMAHMGLGGLFSGYDGKPTEPMMAMRNLACTPRFNERGLAESLYGIVMQDGRKPFPGEVKVG
ncbi:hypothetical protein D187_003203 [Cystobacter fuscus DSM 2262]|uniref:Uncharacterized protein n=1 Tax=Cystobacter fuscus (strain ATCC 25194 / DSM 2262 / NBRC 100088 / M29) TaxID=1242864 RepID=S9QD79_CYSF2|nr:hypothetical protein [Cystobacter fuscus]EPX59299.1 hypothetical protein D187_003203 [Cystobacter fuscus DSM 2262]